MASSRRDGMSKRRTTPVFEDFARQYIERFTNYQKEEEAQQRDGNDNASKSFGEELAEDVDAEHLLEQLYLAATRKFQTRQSDERGTGEAPHSDKFSRSFRKAIIRDSTGNSRAVILVIILDTVRDSEYSAASELWACLIRALSIASHQKGADGLNDHALPLEDTTIKSAFGDHLCHSFRQKQLKYCPPEDLRNRFVRIQNEIRDILDDDKNLIRCKIFDKMGEELDRETRDQFCPEEVPIRIFQQRQDLVRDLYVEGFKQRELSRLQSADLTSQRAKLQGAKTEAQEFVQGVKGRARIFATLVLSNCDASSEAWRSFFELCRCNGRSTRDESLCPLTDDMLPLSLGKIENYFGSHHHTDNEAFESHQHRFSAVKLQKEKQVNVQTSKRRLPLLERREIGSGSFATVYQVLIKEAYLMKRDGTSNSTAKKLAMKVMQPSATNETEWGSAKWLFKQPLRHESIMRATACLKTPDNIYVFFPLASNNLYRYMLGEGATSNGAGPQSPDERMHLFRLIKSIAGALKYLHHELERDFVCIHEDLKAENILVDVDRKGAVSLRLTDFGISSIKRKMPGSSDYQTIKRNSMFEKIAQPRSRKSETLRVMPTKTKLGDDRPNFAPEAVDGGGVDTKFDVWAFGTVFAEYLAWLAGGRRSYLSFERARCGSGEEKIQDYISFRIMENKQAVMREGIATWFQSLIDQTEDKQEKLLYERSWWVLRRKLLVCDPKYRASIKEVYTCLENIVEDKDPDPAYQSREDVPISATALATEPTVSIEERAQSEPAVQPPPISTTLNLADHHNRVDSPRNQPPINEDCDQTGQPVRVDSGCVEHAQTCLPTIMQPGKGMEEGSRDPPRIASPTRPTHQTMARRRSCSRPRQSAETRRTWSSNASSPVLIPSGDTSNDDATSTPKLTSKLKFWKSKTVHNANVDRNSSVTVVRSLETAVETRNTPRFKAALASLDVVESSELISILWKIFWDGLDNLAHLLINKRVDLIWTKAPDRSSLLHLAATHGMIATVKSLLHQYASHSHGGLLTGVSADVLDALDNNSATPLLCALEREHAETAIALLEAGANPSVQDRYKWSALHYLALQRSTEIVDKLVKRLAGDKDHIKAAYVESRNDDDFTPLHVCARSCTAAALELATVLLEQHEPGIGNPANSPDSSGRMALFWTTNENSTPERQKMVDLLITHGARPDGRLGERAHMYRLYLPGVDAR